MVSELRVEQRALAIEKLYVAPPYVGWVPEREHFRRIARAELEREGRLVRALRAHANGCVECQREIAAYEAEFAPPQRTVEQIAADVERELNDFHPGQEQGVRCIVSLVRELVREELTAALGKDGK